MTKTIFTFVAAALFGVLITGGAHDPLGSAPPPFGTSAAPTPSNSPAAARVPIADYYKIVRAQYVNISGNIGTFNTTCFITNTYTQPITLKEVYVLGPGGTTSILATYTGLVGVTVPALGQVRLPIDSATITGIPQETSVSGTGVKSVVVGWTGPVDAVDLNSVIERNDGGNTSGRAFVSLAGVPIIL